MNKRGCGDGADRAGGCAWHGDTAVFAAASRHLVDGADDLGLTSRKLAAIGFSLGGNTLVQWLAQEADADAPDRPRLLAAATVSAPIDLVASTRRLDVRAGTGRTARTCSRSCATTPAATGPDTDG